MVPVSIRKFTGNFFHFDYGKGLRRSIIPFCFSDLSGMEFQNVFHEISVKRSGSRKFSGTLSGIQKISRMGSGNRKISGMHSGNRKIFQIILVSGMCSGIILASGMCSGIFSGSGNMMQSFSGFQNVFQNFSGFRNTFRNNFQFQKWNNSEICSGNGNRNSGFWIHISRPFCFHYRILESLNSWSD